MIFSAIARFVVLLLAENFARSNNREIPNFLIIFFHSVYNQILTPHFPRGFKFSINFYHPMSFSNWHFQFSPCLQIVRRARKEKWAKALKRDTKLNENLSFFRCLFMFEFVYGWRRFSSEINEQKNETEIAWLWTIKRIRKFFK